MQSLTISKTYIFLFVFLSGICYYLGSNLNGNLGWLIWIAPIPVLYASYFVKPRQAFLIAFTAFLIGRLSWLPYLLDMMPVPLAIIFTILLPLIFAILVVVARKICLISPHWFSALAFPVLITAYEYILFSFSIDGTFTSLAYTQINYLPFIQIASVTGLLGISFLVSFYSSALAYLWYYRKVRQITNPLMGVLAALIFVPLIFGLIRLNRTEKGKSVNLGLVVINESGYKNGPDRNSSEAILLSKQYVNEISNLAELGAQVILLPEKAIFVNDSTIDSTLQSFRDLANRHHVQLIIGGAVQKSGYWLNNAWAISDSGKILADYQKVNLFEGEKIDHCKPGNKIGIFSPDSVHQGVAICKDMDFQQFILGYSKKSPAILYVPAWDFVSDGWLHSRMAMMRSVEGGFSLARNARQGRLTISDWRGKVIAEVISESGTKTILTGKLSIEPHPTIYARAGDWFGTINLFAALGFTFFMFKNRKSARKDPESES